MDTAIGDEHRSTVERLSQGLRDAQGLPVGLLRGPSTLYRVRRAGPRHWVDLSGLDRVLDIPERGDWVDVEGGATWRQLVAALAPRGLVPAVVPEDADQCVGAALADVAVGAASSRHGPVHATLLEMDVLLPDGRVVRCSDEEREDLFHGFPGSCGTLGYVLRARLRTESATPMLAVREEPVASSSDLVAVLLRDAEDDVLGTEGLARSRHDGMVRSARCLDGPLRQGERAMKLEDWLWRWTRDRDEAAWAWRPPARLHFDAPDEDVVQDVVVPAAAAAELVDLVLEDLGIQPLWLCGLRGGCGAASPLFPLRAEASYVNVGIWGRVRGAGDSSSGNRRLETWVARLGGFKAPYAQCFLPSDEFDLAYDMAAYARLKSKYDPLGRAPHLYDKCVRGG
ncbi:FAD-binding oxidoreductase [Ramlibacter sp. MMS24-I3-19]|uniref:FAD-binding oxidoreductase n=1 Tax=Ramlibacter sp. MMS24-I3-19 TaxID=3416606 RepID=UPI003D05F18F